MVVFISLFIKIPILAKCIHIYNIEHCLSDITFVQLNNFKMSRNRFNYQIMLACTYHLSTYVYL